MTALRLSGTGVAASLALLISSLASCGGGVATEAGQCERTGNILHYESPGCGTAQPEPVCGHPGMLGCYAGYFCNCDGTVRGYCEHWSEKPWAYYVPGSPMNVVTPCDPNNPPPGAADGGF